MLCVILASFGGVVILWLALIGFFALTKAPTGTTQESTT